MSHLLRKKITSCLILGYYSNKNYYSVDFAYCPVQINLISEYNAIYKSRNAYNFVKILPNALHFNYLRATSFKHLNL